jgi:hypothetical protein
MISRESSESKSEILRGELGGSEGCGSVEEMEGDGDWVGRSRREFSCKLVIIGCDKVTSVVVLGQMDRGGVDIASRNVGGG